MKLCPLRKIRNTGTRWVDEFAPCLEGNCMWYIKGTQNCAVTDLANIAWLFAEGDRTLFTYSSR